MNLSFCCNASKLLHKFVWSAKFAFSTFAQAEDFCSQTESVLYKTGSVCQDEDTGDYIANLSWIAKSEEDCSTQNALHFQTSSETLDDDMLLAHGEENWETVQNQVAEIWIDGQLSQSSLQNLCEENSPLVAFRLQAVANILLDLHPSLLTGPSQLPSVFRSLGGQPNKINST